MDGQPEDILAPAPSTGWAETVAQQWGGQSPGASEFQAKI